MRRRAGRPADGREVLTRERIVDAAMDIVDSDGVPALTMRRLAKALRVDPMAIYHHLANRDALLAALTRKVFEHFSTEAWRGRSWKAIAREWATTYRDTVRAHPNLVVHVVQHPQATADFALPAAERLLRAFDEVGLPPRSMMVAVDTLGDFLNGWLVAEAVQPPMVHASTWPPMDDYPTVRRVIAAAPPSSGNARFERCLLVVLAGIEAANPSLR